MDCRQKPTAKTGKVSALNTEAYEILLNMSQACKIEPLPNCHAYFEKGEPESFSGRRCMNGVKTGAMGLLDILAAKNGCMYLSNLAGTGSNMFLFHHLYEISAQDFSLREWEDAVSYLTGQNRTFADPEQAKQYLFGCTLNQRAENHEKR